MSEASPREETPVLDPRRGMELNARTATILLLAAVLAQVLCGIVIGVIAVALTWPGGIHDVSQIQRMLDKLAPLTILLPVVAGIVTIGMAKALVPAFLKDVTPTGAAWVPGNSLAVIKGLTLGLFIGGCFYALNMILRSSFTYERVSYQDLGSFDKLPYSSFWIVVWVIGGVFIVPFSEEILFRGVTYSGYRRSLGPIWAAVITTGTFIVLHVLHLPDIFSFVLNAAALTMLSLTALWCRLRWRAIGPAIAVHAGYNGLIACVVAYQLPP